MGELTVDAAYEVCLGDPGNLMMFLQEKQKNTKQHILYIYIFEGCGNNSTP